ncbi:MAG: hypothetical protein LBU30_00510, partial [Candidatus Methanoplasma sp.]|nr:hypothetical protein [Candidatus Methanoplasma sp.]
MRFNKNGSLGFPEAMIAAMIVTLSLTLYMGLVVMDMAGDREEPEILTDRGVFRDLTIIDGEIGGDIESILVSEMERHGYRGIYFSCEMPGDRGFGKISALAGEMTDNVV